MLSPYSRPRLHIEISAQPDDTTCGPTCLEAIYRYHGEEISFGDTVEQIPAFAEGGTLCVHLACHALDQGFPVTLYSYNLRIFDPSWFGYSKEALAEALRLRLQKHPGGKKRRAAMQAYRQFILKGGEVKFDDLTPALIKQCLNGDQPILAGLSATWLYQSKREIPETCADDDINGEPVGHFVILSGYDRESKRVRIADPYLKNPLATHYYSADLGRLTTAILLGVLTYDANLLIIHPQKK